MNIISGSRLFWAILLLAVYMALGAPMTLSDALNSIGHVIAVTASGPTRFLGDIGTSS